MNERLAEPERTARRVDVDGVTTAVWEAGDGPAVVCVHGVPVSAWVYRNMLPELAARGMRGVAFDLPGLGLADRAFGESPADLSWTGLGRYAAALVDRLGLREFHLVVHDIGGPVGFEVAHALPDRVASITVLNTLIEVASFRKPWVMRPFEVVGLGELWLGAMIDPLFVSLMYLQGISDRAVVPPAEIAAHLRLLRRGDGGRAFLRVMRSFEPTAEKQERYLGVFEHERPVQAIWGARDPALRLDTYGAVARRLVGEDRFFETDGKHFLQETHAPFIAERVAALVGRR